MEERAIYIANFERMWMLLINCNEPGSGNYKGYRVSADQTEKAIEVADRLVCEYQGKHWSEVQLPELLI